MRVVVLGAGAVGGLFGARLAAAGEEVVLVARPATVEAVRAHGLRVEGLGAGTFRLRAATEVPPAPAEVVLVTVKSFDLRSAAGALARALEPTPTVLLGNGLGIEEEARAGLLAGGWARPETEVVRAVHTVPATLVAPGVVRASGTGEIVLPEPQAAGPTSPALEVASRVLARTGYPVRGSGSFEREVWRKAVVNAAINPVTAAHGVPNGTLLSGPLREEAERLLDEAVRVARASGIDLAPGEARADLERVVEATAVNRSSMLQDVERGRPTEIAAISGELLRRGRALGLDLPATARAIAAVEARVEGTRRSAQRS